MSEINIQNKNSTITENLSFTWTIKRWSAFKKKDMHVDSPVFPKFDSFSKWEMYFYPYGDSDRSSKYCSLYLCPINLCHINRIIATYSLSILNSEGEKVNDKQFTSYTYSKPFIPSGFPFYCKVQTLNRNVMCDELKIGISIQATIVISNSIGYLNAYPNGFLSDFTIIVDDIHIAVHKNVLETNSSVFSTMLREMSENGQESIEITDIDKIIVAMLIRFMYTGEVTISNDEEAAKLLYGADKYNLLKMKNFCEKYLTINMNKSNVMNILILSDRYKLSTLKQCAINFITENSRCFSDKMFQSVLDEAPYLLVELITEMTRKLNGL